MARPRSWFETREYNDARRAAKERGHKLFKYTRQTREGKVAGLFVGRGIPERLKHAKIEARKV